MSAEIRVHIMAVGRVQGVNYRWFTMTTAQKLGLKGWVTNLDNGNVEAEVEGDQDQVNILIDMLREGPPLARVDQLNVSPPESVYGYKDFRVR
jgi:acylphosphatase